MNTSTTDTTNEVARLKEMIIDAARRGDEMAAHWKERAEKAESIIKQLNHYAGIIEEKYAGIIKENHTSTDHVTTHVTNHLQ